MIPVYDKYPPEDEESNDYIREIPNSVYEAEILSANIGGFILGFGVGGMLAGIVWAVYYMV